MRRILATLATLALVALALLSATGTPVLRVQVTTPAPAPVVDTVTVVGTYAVPGGDLTVWSDGTAVLLPIHEDDPRWDCRTMGNLICGENNRQGVPAGYYGPVS